MKTEFPLVVKLPLNEKGRDFVLGDIHGSFDLVWKAMRQVKFDPAVDRLIVVGDLIDRGEGSRRCVKFLALPYVFAVRGNHEDMWIDLYSEGAISEEDIGFFCKTEYAEKNGFVWWKDIPEAQRQEILAAIRKLPIAIELPTARGTVGIVHADVPKGMPWQEFTKKIESGDKHVIKTALWGRDRVKAKCRDGVEGIGRVFVGHSIQWGGATKYGNVYAIDTGAVFGVANDPLGGHLTIANMVFKTGLLLEDRVLQDKVALLGADIVPDN